MSDLTVLALILLTPSILFLPRVCRFMRDCRRDGVNR